MTLKQTVDSFILEQRLKGNTDKTILGYTSILTRFTDWLAGKGVSLISELTLFQVQSYQLYIDSKPAERGGNEKLTKRSVQTYMRHIKAFLTYCHSEEFIVIPLHKKIKLPKAERPTIEILTDDEISTILSTFTKSETGLRNRALICLLLDCGLRLSEATGIETENINFEKGYMKVLGKGRKERIIPVGLKVRRLMLAYVNKRRAADAPEDDKYFFLNKYRKPVSDGCIGTLMGRLKKRTGIARLHAHLFRHTFATNFLVNGLGDVYELSRILGHSEMKVTEMYLQLASYYTIIEKRRKLSYLDMQK
ncbi:MAG: tyrosine-type recombinase/integrase [Defluviitaleaceae bacterium]|nr:tyrosine-type recombinase/integrase [Defluviitaleaceae bacterium]